MKKILFSAAILSAIIVPRFSSAAEAIKLPFAAGAKFVVTTGYDTPPMHIKKDGYAIDLTQNGCDAYGQPAVAAFSGTAWIVEESGYNGGYGTQLLIIAQGNVVARYAHLIPGSIPFSVGDTIPQGTIVGEIGDTGLVMGTACAEHPGTHIHFAMDTENGDGSFAAKDPEPISGYTGITVGQWYVSDNVLAATKENLASLAGILGDLFGSSVTVVSPSNMATGAVPSGTVAVPMATGLGQTSPVAAISSSAVPTVISPVSLVPSFPESLSPASSSQSAGNSGPTTTTVARPETASVSAGGGGGGVSVYIPVAALVGSATDTASGTATVVPDDPADDLVPVCE
jgi:murein DD-endopeptidase MepM/ murein hydrolase activator NlpD